MGVILQLTHNKIVMWKEYCLQNERHYIKRLYTSNVQIITKLYILMLCLNGEILRTEHLHLHKKASVCQAQNSYWTQFKLFEKLYSTCLITNKVFCFVWLLEYASWLKTHNISFSNRKQCWKLQNFWLKKYKQNDIIM